MYYPKLTYASSTIEGVILLGILCLSNKIYGFYWIILEISKSYIWKKPKKVTALQSRTGPEQGFPCVVFPHREKPVFITGFPGDKNRFFPVRKTTQGKPCFHCREWVCSVESMWLNLYGCQAVWRELKIGLKMQNCLKICKTVYVQIFYIDEQLLLITWFANFNFGATLFSKITYAHFL